MRDRIVSGRKIVATFGALFVLISCMVVSEIGLAHLLGFWLLFATLPSVRGVSWRLKIVL